MTTKQLREAITYWQTVLNLGDWNIRVRIGKKIELTDPDGNECLGMNFIYPEELQSEIILKRGESEETLVHEMLHIVFDGDVQQDGLYDVLHERAINRTAKALLKVRGE